MKTALKALVPALALVAALAMPTVARADEHGSRGRHGYYSRGYSHGGHYRGHYARPYGYGYGYPRYRYYAPRYYSAPPYAYGYYGPGYGYGYYPPPPPTRPRFGIGLYFGF
jgi:hypothetical protein